MQNMKFLDGHKYYMRLDDDSMFTGKLREDPFEMMEREKLKYAYIRADEDFYGIDLLWSWAKPYFDSATDPYTGFLDGQPGSWRYGGRQPYNNFHISSVKMWRSPLWRQFSAQMDKGHGFFKYRFGDANVHAVALSIMAKVGEVSKVHLPYGHNVKDLPDYGKWALVWDEYCKANPDYREATGPAFYNNEVGLLKSKPKN